MSKFIYATILILCTLNTSAQYKEGYYIDSSENHISGLLKFSYGGNLFTDKKKGDCRLLFKKTEGDSKISFAPLQIKGFVIGSDSFTVIYNFSINAFAHYPQDFAKVLESGEIKLYEYLATSGSMSGGFYTSSDVSYWIIKKGEKQFLLKHGNFREVMEEFTADDPELLDLIKTKELKFKNSREVVKKYNEFRRNAKV